MKNAKSDLDSVTIEGKIGNQSYQFKIAPNLQPMDFVEAMQLNKKRWKSKFLNKETVAISVWTTPKRTKTYPLARVYDTLSYDGTKITIIPVLTDYGKHGERGKIQPGTVDWMTNVGVYLILGVYVDAEKGKVGRLAKNAGIKTKSSEGKPKFAKGQKFDLKYLKKIKNVGLTASASAPEILVQNFIKYLNNNFNVILNDTNYIKENVIFNIPKQLKVAS